MSKMHYLMRSVGEHSTPSHVDTFWSSFSRVLMAMIDTLVRIVQNRITLVYNFEMGKYTLR